MLLQMQILLRNAIKILPRHYETLFRKEPPGGLSRAALHYLRAFLPDRPRGSWPPESPFSRTRLTRDNARVSRTHPSNIRSFDQFIPPLFCSQFSSRSVRRRPTETRDENAPRARTFVCSFRVNSKVIDTTKTHLSRS